MGSRQQEKSEMTRTELKEAAKRLFLECGYDSTSIQDIGAAAGYSVGSVYRQWKSKQQLFMEIWDEYVSGYIRESVLYAPEAPDGEEMIEYLLMRSRIFAEADMTRKLYSTSLMLSAMYEYEGVADWAYKYQQMLYLFLKQVSKTKDERRLKTTASILHCLLNADAMSSSNVKSPKYEFESQYLKESLIAIVNTCKAGDER